MLLLKANLQKKKMLLLCIEMGYTISTKDYKTQQNMYIFNLITQLILQKKINKKCTFYIWIDGLVISS